jgi:hypothetical protein
MLLLNFSHPLSPDQLAKVTELTGQPIDEVRHYMAQFDQDRPFIPQAEALIEQIGLSPQAWQSAPLIVVLPALNHIAAVVLAELHGRMGYFPPIVRLKPVAGALPPRYEVAEVINLQGVRDAARLKRL